MLTVNLRPLAALSLVAIAAVETTLAADYAPMGGSFCDPAVVGLLREQYTISEVGSISQAMKRSVCTSTVDGSNGAISIPIKNVTVGLSFGSTNSAKACVLTENFYSEAFAREMSYSYLPPQAFELLASCNDGLFMTVDQPSPGTSVVRVGYRGFSNGIPAPGKIGKVEYDRNAIVCDGDITSGTVLYSLPRQTTCVHKKSDGLYTGSSFRVVLDDDVTDRGVYLGGTEEIAIPWRVVWVLNNAKARVGFRCITDASDAESLQNVSVFACATEGDCKSETTNLGVCIAKLGHAVRVGHEASTMVRSQWSFKPPIKPTTLVCVKDGVEKTFVGSKVNFTTWKTYALEGYCAFNWPKE